MPALTHNRVKNGFNGGRRLLHATPGIKFARTTDKGNAMRANATIGGIGSKNRFVQAAIKRRIANSVDGNCCRLLTLLRNVNIVSSNTDVNYAKAGDTVTLTFSAGSNITPSVIFLSGQKAITATVTYTNTANSWTVKYIPHTNDTDGIISYTIDIVDSNGKRGDSVTTGSGSVTYDNTPPTAAITYSSTGPYKQGDVVIITATFTETIVNIPKIDIVGVSSIVATDMVVGATEKIWTYSYTGPSGDGVETIMLSVGEDAAGNVTQPAATNATFTIDNTIVLTIP
jgi:hypothetical protein